MTIIGYVIYGTLFIIAVSYEKKHPHKGKKKGHH